VQPFVIEEGHNYMRIRYFFQLIYVTLLLLACDEKDPDQLDNRNFVLGNVVIGINSSVSLNEVFELMNEKAAFIEQMNGFFNYSTLPKDSLEYVKNILKSKPYTQQSGIEEASAFVSENDSRIVVTESLFKMDTAAQHDWLLTLNKLELKDLGNETKNLVISVGPGSEKYWIDIFRRHPYVTWAELNYVGGFEPL
jgi:hypothetical protein